MSIPDCSFSIFSLTQNLFFVNFCHLSKSFLHSSILMIELFFNTSCHRYYVLYLNTTLAKFVRNYIRESGDAFSISSLLSEDVDDALMSSLSLKFVLKFVGV